MIARHAVRASRIRQALGDLGRVLERVERAARAGRQENAEADLLLDSAALNLHGFSSAPERTFTQIASTLDQNAPAGPDWQRDLPRQMTIEGPGLRPRALSPDTAAAIDEFLRFRHVVRRHYASRLEPERVESLAARLRQTFRDVGNGREAFASFLDGPAYDS